MYNREKVEEIVRDLLLAMGKDINTEGLKDTPRRVAGYWEELLEGENYTNEENCNTKNIRSNRFVKIN